MRIRQVLVSGIALLACAGCNAPAAAPLHRPSSPTSGSSSATVPTRTPRMTAEQVVDDPTSALQQLVLGPGRSMAAVWRWCATRSCRHSRNAVVVTDDGFDSRVVLDLPTGRQLGLREAGDDSVVVTRNRPAWVVGYDGGLTPVTRTTARRPAPPGEIVLNSLLHVVAIDPESGVEHRVPAPERLFDISTVHGRIRGITYPPEGKSEYAVSVDGGKTWGSVVLPVRHALWMPVEDSRTPAFVQGGDGATLFPFEAAWRYGSARFTRSPPPTDPTAYVSCAHRLPDGRLLVCVEAWSDQRRSHAPTPPGFWISTDRSWSRLDHVEPGRPFSDTPQGMPLVLASRRTTHGLVFAVLDQRSGAAYLTHDLGRTFTPMAAR